MKKLILPFPVSQQLQLAVSFSYIDSKPFISGVRYCQSELADSKSEDEKSQSSYEPEQLIYVQTIKSELEEYLNDAKFKFSLSCNFQLGTAFQQRVWKALTEIPSGEVKTYGELAKELNSSARAIGNACRNNLFPVIVPCHRVVSASGIGGYAGDTLDTQKGEINFLQIKKWLLDHEAVG
ncbi:MAG: MGMT family protein [Gammaproteobacteria bacterium]|nr:MGMT family protein [Gammaproteobacteria bacterium]